MKSKGKSLAFAAVSLPGAGRRAAQRWGIPSPQLRETALRYGAVLHTVVWTLEAFQEEKKDVLVVMGIWSSPTLVTAAPSLG